MTVHFTFAVEEPEKLIMPFPELIFALGRTPLNPHPCRHCQLVILFGDLCVACAEKYTLDRLHTPSPN